MIEYMEESILCLFFSGKFMDIIKDKDINHLIEMEKIIFIIISYRLYKLRLKFICIYIENGFIRMFLFHKNTYCLSKMCFPQT